MPLPKSKAIKLDGWAALFANEIKRRETAFPSNAVSVAQLQGMRKEAGLASGQVATYSWLSNEVKAGRVKRIDGIVCTNGKLNRATRYLFV